MNTTNQHLAMVFIVIIALIFTPIVGEVTNEVVDTIGYY